MSWGDLSKEQGATFMPCGVETSGRLGKGFDGFLSMMSKSVCESDGGLKVNDVKWRLVTAVSMALQRGNVKCIEVAQRRMIERDCGGI